MTDRIPVKNERMVRDRHSHALLSTDHDAVAAYEKRRREAKAQKDRINRLEQEVNELKQLLSQLIEKR
jgi:uncharacterized protein YceH (UPF0502 family)